MAKKSEYMAFLMDDKSKRDLERYAFEARLTQGEIIRRALAFYFASVLSTTNHDDQEVEVEGAPA